MFRGFMAVCLFCASWLATPGVHAEDFKIAPPPLAIGARTKPERNAFELLDAGSRKDRTRYSVLIGMHDWAGLEKDYQALDAAYRGKTIDADEYVRRVRWFAPDNGQIQLADLEQWVKERPSRTSLGTRWACSTRTRPGTSAVIASSRKPARSSSRR